MNRRGWTLLEAIVCVAIVVLMAVLVIAAVHRQQQRRYGHMHRGECSANLHIFALQMAMYAQTAMYAQDYGPFPAGPATNEGRLGLLYPLYTDNMLQFYCPGRPRPLVDYDIETGKIVNSDYYLDGWIPADVDPKRAVMGDFNKDGMNHEGGSNILFADGQVEWVKMDEAGRHPNPYLPDIDPDIYAIDTQPRHPDDADLD